MLVDTIRSSIGPRLRAGQSAEQVRRDLLAQVRRAFGKTHTDPALALLVPGKVELAGVVLDEALAGLEPSRN